MYVNYTLMSLIFNFCIIFHYFLVKNSSEKIPRLFYEFTFRSFCKSYSIDRDHFFLVFLLETFLMTLPSLSRKIYLPCCPHIVSYLVYSVVSRHTNGSVFIKSHLPHKTHLFLVTLHPLHNFLLHSHS